MTKKEMLQLKRGDIVVHKSTGDQFCFNNLVKVSDIRLDVSDGGFKFEHERMELACRKIEGIEYNADWRTSGGFFVFPHKKMERKVGGCNG